VSEAFAQSRDFGSEALELRVFGFERGQLLIVRGEANLPEPRLMLERDEWGLERERRRVPISFREAGVSEDWRTA
jgi:hypothetical protein